MFNLTIARITARALFGRKRFLFLLPLPLLLVGLAILTRSLGATPEEWVGPVVQGLGLVVVMPVVALIVGTGVLGSEIDDGTLAHILSKPLARREIIFSKLVVAIAVTFVTTAVPLFITGLIAGSTQFAVALVVGAAVGSIVYCCLFVALSLLTRLPVLVGLAYVLIWEATLSNLLSGTRVLSVQQYMVTVADRIYPSELLQTNVSLPVSLGMAFVIAAGTTLLAIDRLRSFSVVGETA